MTNQSKVVNHFSNKCSFTVNMKSVLDLVRQFFFFFLLGDMSEWGGKKISTMDDAMQTHWKGKGYPLF